jgi:uncharacterized protein YceK
MKTNKFAPFVFSMMVVLAVVLSGCTPVRALSKVKTAAPEEVVESFYDWHLGYPGNVMVGRAYRSSEYLTQEFIEKVDEIIASFDKGGYDPFLCAQDVPGDLVFDKAVVSGGEASVIVHEVWNPGTEYEAITDVLVNLRMMDGQWKISDIFCKGSEAREGDKQTTDWRVFRDDEYGFQIRYPAQWTIEEAKIEIESAGGDIPIKRVVGFGPEDWEDPVKPVSIEVGVGSLEELQGMWPIEAADHTTINGYTVLIGEGMYGEVFCIFEHPTDPELRVVVRDYLPMIGDVTGNENISNIVQQMASTFSFIR